MRQNKASFPRWDHQQTEFDRHGDDRSRALIWPMRSGKSRALIDVACRQFRRQTIEGAVIIAPNGVHLNWARNEIPTWVSLDAPHRIFAWETTKWRREDKQRQWAALLGHPGPKWLCVNMDALIRDDCREAIRTFLRRVRREFFLGVSEAHHFGRPGAKRTHFARSLSYHANYVRTETGTPILTGPLRAFSQYELLAPGALGYPTFKEFKARFAEFEQARRGSRTYEKLARYINLDELRRGIGGWSSLVLRSELGDMPELVRTERPVEMSDAQRAAYLEMVKRHLIEIGDEPVTAKDGGPRMMKLQQILGGFIADSQTRQIHEIDPNCPIYEATIEEIQGTVPGKALVWCRYKEECRRLIRKLQALNIPTLAYFGDFSSDVREANRAQFLRPDDSSVMVGTPDCGGEGLDFSAADAVIFHSGNPNARMMAQAEERATVKGGKSVAVVRVRNYGTVCDRIWEIVDGNVSLADTVTGTGLRDLLLSTDV